MSKINFIVEYSLETYRKDGFLDYIERFDNGDYIDNLSDAIILREKLLNSGKYKEINVMHRLVTVWDYVKIK